jgi:hypothetical protein
MINRLSRSSAVEPRQKSRHSDTPRQTTDSSWRTLLCLGTLPFLDFAMGHGNSLLYQYY